MSQLTLFPEAPALPRELVLASAGTGKTFRISSRIIGLLAAGAAPDAIFASTFTRAAAGEILDRVLQRLARAALDPAAAAELNEHVSLGGSARPTFAAADWLRLLGRVVRDLHRLNISTLDSFFVRTATTFADDVGLPPGWTIADRAVADRVRAEALNAVLAQGDGGELVELIRGVDASLVKRSVHDALLLRTTELLALHDALDPAAEDPWGGFDELSRQVPDDLETRRLGLAEAFLSVVPPLSRSGEPRKSWLRALISIADALHVGDWGALLRSTLFQNARRGVGRYDRVDIPDEVLALIKEAAELARYAAARRLSVQSRAMRRLTAHLAEAAERARRERGAYEFGDVTRVVGGTDPLCLRPDLHYRLDARAQHILLDEFQDTSIAQWEALQPLVDELFSGYAAERSAVVVADPKQSIYAWRGGEPLLVGHVSQRYPLTLDSLSKSWRSSQVVLDTVNRIFASIHENGVIGKDAIGGAVARQWRDAFEPHTAAKQLPGFMQLLVGPEDEGRGEDRPRLCRRAAELVAELRRSAPGMTIGVLTRTNPTVARLMLELRDLGVDASEEGGNPLTDSAAVSAVLALLALADHPGDRIARYHVAMTPLGTVVEYTDPRDGGAARRLAERTRRRLLEQGYGRTLSEIARELTPACNARDRRRLSQLAELGFRYDPCATLRPSDFIPVVEAERVEDSTSADVRVMTIHKSKGLEFDIVVLPELDAPLMRSGNGLLTYRPDPAGRIARVFPYVDGATRDLFPDVPELQEAAGQAASAGWRDGLSGLYVALTRARHALHLVVKPDAVNAQGKVTRSTACTGATLVRWALAPEADARPGDVLYEDGDPRWFEKVRAGEDGARSDDGGAGGAASRVPVGGSVSVALKPSSGRRVLGQVAPSALAGGSRVDLRWLLGLDRSGAERGTLIHAWLQRIGWLEDGIPSDDDLREIARSVVPTLSAVSADELRGHLRSWLDTPVVRARLRRDSYPAGATVEREVPFLHRAEGRLVEGVIDRLVLLREGGKVVGAEVLDYKTDALDGAGRSGIAAKVAHYRPQMEAYRAAVASGYQLRPDRVAAQLMFLEAGAVVEV